VVLRLFGQKSATLVESVALTDQPTVG